jgi:ATP-dependent Clp protease protease subunit
MNRNYILSGTVNETTIKDTVAAILEINRLDDEEEERLKSFERKPINIYINTNGGNIYDGLALIDIISASKTPVYTYCIGKCFSMGLIILLAGHIRFIGRNATVLFHGASFGEYDKIPDVEETLEEAKRLQSILVDFVVQKSKLKRQELEDIIDSRADWYLSAKEAIKKGIVDAYL